MTLDLTLDEVNLVLVGLSKLSYEQVNALIPKIQEQGRDQLPKASDTGIVEDAGIGG